ncbi:uncharacterized protein CLUP02_08128 [Colletotrichum lupini]|uniref:Uncharacterized protein n=1 Tax=Colletotrichum lupini TaxID=145971 RepID=A0A9Q8SSZ3_9PEZI|nr:uncharacterized protein CLUP02_08128 [Colletotrichum lupini]UQC82638.1 hypothetical protein CLUP02_08128 [Colletotrichum lupini]
MRISWSSAQPLKLDRDLLLRLNFRIEVDSRSFPTLLFEYRVRLSLVNMGFQVLKKVYDPSASMHGFQVAPKSGIFRLQNNIDPNWIQTSRELHFNICVLYKETWVARRKYQVGLSYGISVNVLGHKETAYNFTPTSGSLLYQKKRVTFTCTHPSKTAVKIEIAVIHLPFYSFHTTAKNPLEEPITETKPLVQGGKESVTESLEAGKYTTNCYYSENDSTNDSTTAPGQELRASRPSCSDVVSLMSFAYNGDSLRLNIVDVYDGDIQRLDTYPVKYDRDCLSQASYNGQEKFCFLSLIKSAAANANKPFKEAAMQRWRVFQPASKPCLLSNYHKSLIHPKDGYDHLGFTKPDGSTIWECEESPQ